MSNKGQILKLTNVELVYPKLGTPDSFGDDPKKRWDGWILLDEEQFEKAAKVYTEECANAGFSPKDLSSPKLFKKGKAAAVLDKMCLKFSSNAARKDGTKNHPPVVYDKSNRLLSVEEADEIGSGTIAHAALRIQCYKNSYGAQSAVYPVQFQIQKAEKIVRGAPMFDTEESEDFLLTPGESSATIESESNATGFFD